MKKPRRQPSLADVDIGPPMETVDLGPLDVAAEDDEEWGDTSAPSTDDDDDPVSDEEDEPSRVPTGRPSASIDERLNIAKTRAMRRYQLKVAESLVKNVETMIALAQGIWVEETTPEGKRRVYQKAPDAASLKFLVEQGIGKATVREKTSTAPVINLIHQVPRPRKKRE